MDKVDQYIIDHHTTMSAVEMSEILNKNRQFIQARKKSLGIGVKAPQRERSEKYIHPEQRIRDEMNALVVLIHERETGWAVDAAKVRLEQLQKTHYK